MPKKLLFLCLSLLLALPAGAQSFTLLSWNIQDLGRSKDTAEVAAIVELLRDYDLVVIQEVVAKDPAGAQTVARIADELNRKGEKWDSRISPPTQSPSSHKSERYAILWKTARLDLLGAPWLDSALAMHCVREPYLARFRLRGSGKPFFLANFHSRKFDERPEEEIRHFADYPQRLQTERVFIAGDFNLDEQHRVWQALYRQGFAPALRRTPTTLKQKCDARGNYFNHAIDNIYFPEAHFQVICAGRVDFVGSCEALAVARGISDHVPVFLEVKEK